MQGAAWIGLFRRIPAEQHNTIMLMTTTGAEVVVQRILRLDRDFLACEGRLAGSTDQGRFILLPYEQISYLCFAKKLSDAETLAVLGKPGVAVKLVETAVAPQVEEVVEEIVEEVTEAVLQPVEDAAPSEAVPQPAPTAQTPMPAAKEPLPAAAGASSKVAPLSKSVLLARLRQRLASDIAKQPGA